MKTLPATKIDQSIKRFNELVTEGVRAWTEAGKLLVQIVDSDPQAYDKILGEAQGLTRAHLAKFEAIGRGQIEPRLLLNGSIGYQRLSKAPLSDQRRALNDGIPLYEPTADGETTHRIVRPEDLNPFEASQVFAPGGAIRSPEEQRAYLAKRKSRNAVEGKRVETVDVPDYTIKGQKVTFNAGCTLTVGQIANILQQLTKGK